MNRIPVLLVGDGPNLPSGLGRIGRDLASGLWQEREVLGIDLAYLGFGYQDEPFPWPTRPIHDGENWGEADLINAWYGFFGERRGIILSIFDPGRCFALTAQAGKIPVQLWGYFALDAETPAGGLSTAATAALSRYKRVLAYGEWGAQVMRKALQKPIQWLPHGLGDEWTPSAPPGPLVGCVATNQHRKDLALLFDCWARMKKQREELTFWLHTNMEIGQAWAIPELAAQYQIPAGSLLVTGLDGAALPDDTLIGLYSQCLVTIAPGLGEGFGYPIVESLACGTPVIHGRYAGGVELIPREDWLVDAAAWRVEGPHVLRRPVFEADEFAQAALEAIDWKLREPALVAAYCTGAVEHLRWRHLWPRWRSWVSAGLKEVRG